MDTESIKLITTFSYSLHFNLYNAGNEVSHLQDCFFLFWTSLLFYTGSENKTVPLELELQNSSVYLQQGNFE
jgi:hypothetical protein